MPSSWPALRLLKYGLGYCLLAVFILLTSPLVPAAAAQEAPASPADKPLRFDVALPDGPLSIGEEGTVAFVVSNAGDERIEQVEVHLPHQPAIRWLDEAEVGWLSLGELQPGESRMLQAAFRVQGIQPSGALQLRFRADGRQAPAVVEQAVLRLRRLPARQATLPVAGGELTDPADAAHLVFPSGWHDRPATVTLDLLELGMLEADEAGRALLLGLSADDGGPFTLFDAPVTVTVDASALFDAPTSDDPPVVSTRMTEDENWTTLPSSFDPASGELTFETTAVGQLQVSAEPELWRLLYNPPGASAYSGSASYQIPIELPPGIGGLTPDLTLVYSSRSADGMRAPAMARASARAGACRKPRSTTATPATSICTTLPATRGTIPIASVWCSTE